MAKFPDEMVIAREQWGDTDDEAEFTVHRKDEIGDLDDGTEVAVYKLQQVGKVAVTRSIDVKIIDGGGN